MFSTSSENGGKIMFIGAMALAPMFRVPLLQNVFRMITSQAKKLG